jgi:DNA mismatch repair protein MutL
MQFALIHPSINFQLCSEDHEIINTTGIDNAEVLLIQFYGSSLRGNLIPIHHTFGSFIFDGFISSPTMSFANKTKQVIAVNQRLIKSGVIQKSLSASYKDLISGNRHPALLLHITANQQDIDVNIHPQKHEIKFLNPGHIFQSMPRAIQHALYDYQSRQIDVNLQEPTPQHDNKHPIKTINASINIPEHAIQTTFSTQNQTESITSPIPPISQIPEFTDNMPSIEPSPDMEITFIQIYDTYIALKGPEGQLWLLDQHAVHERILYEKYKVQFENAQIAYQALLVPVIIELSKSDQTHLESIIGHLNTLGFTAETYGPQEIAIREVPTLMASCHIPDLVQQLIDSVQTLSSPICDLTLEMKSELQMKACKAAIKAGKQMSAPEVQALLRDLIQCPSNFTCPHGRPLIISFDKKKLETLFKRS